ncbi:MAG: hypothetical protein GEU99_15115 [Luteitalea sp.]|nr:hypothetical protein [Luteitalea sp.]
MRRSVIRSAIGAVVLFSFADAPGVGQESRVPETKETGQWRVDLVSSGGITGKGTGGVGVTSDGTAQLLQFSPRGAHQQRGGSREEIQPNSEARANVAVTCTTKLALHQIAPLDSAVSRIAPEHWRVAAALTKTPRCCDLLEWTLTVSRPTNAEHDERLVSSWAADGTKGREVPAAVAEVHEALVALWPRVRSGCSTER